MYYRNSWFTILGSLLPSLLYSPLFSCPLLSSKVEASPPMFSPSSVCKWFIKDLPLAMTSHPAIFSLGGHLNASLYFHMTSLKLSSAKNSRVLFAALLLPRTSGSTPWDYLCFQFNYDSLWHRQILATLLYLVSGIHSFYSDFTATILHLLSCCIIIQTRV